MPTTIDARPRAVKSPSGGVHVVTAGGTALCGQRVRPAWSRVSGGVTCAVCWERWERRMAVDETSTNTNDENKT